MSKNILVDEMIEEEKRWLYIREANAVLSAATGIDYTSHPHREGQVMSPLFTAIGRGQLTAKRRGPFWVIDPDSFKEYVRQFKPRITAQGRRKE